MRRIQIVEGLRGILALWVLFAHVLASAGLGTHWVGPFSILANGVNAVDVFIIVSGFVIFYLLDTSRESYQQFIWRRFLRLYPVYLICLVVSALTIKLVIYDYSHAPWPTSVHNIMVMIANTSYALLPYHLIAHLTMTHSIIPDHVLLYSDYAILGPAWSLSLEWQFYLIAPLIFLSITRSVTSAYVMIIIAVALHATITGVEGCLPRHIPNFAVGIASYYLLKQSWRPTWPLLAPAGVALTYFMTRDPALTIWSIIFFVEFQSETLLSTAMRSFLESGILLWLGKISYSVYLSHMIVLTIMMALLYSGGAGSLGQWPFFILLLLSTVAGTLSLSWVLFVYVERPAIAFGKTPVINLTRPRRAAGGT